MIKQVLETHFNNKEIISKRTFFNIVCHEINENNLDDLVDKISIDEQRIDNYLCGYQIKNRLLFFSYDKLVQKLSKYNDPMLVNLYLLFYIFHEVEHLNQTRLIQTNINSLESALFSQCFNFVSSATLPFTRILNKLLYDKYHDYFITEINADLNSYEHLIKILKDITSLSKYVNYFLKVEYERIVKVYQISDDLVISPAEYLSDLHILDIPKVPLSKGLMPLKYGMPMVYQELKKILKQN